jgi:hypothetical protein
MSVSTIAVGGEVITAWFAIPEVPITAVIRTPNY